ncbi:MAG: hypothetical protein ACXACU_11250 [Candidatus Hodarchaeales archaeon]
MNFTPDLLIALAIGIACVTIEITLSIVLSRRYSSSGRPKTIIIFLVALLALLVADGSALIAMFIVEETTFISIQRLSYIGSIVSICGLLFFFEAFEHDSIFTPKQMVHTALGGMAILSALVGSFGMAHVPAADINRVVLDPISELLLFLIVPFGSILIIWTLYSGYKDAWFVQKRQLKIMMVGIAIAYLLPVFLNLVLANILKSVAFAIYIRANVAIGFILYFASFGGSKTFGLFNRQQAERAIIINENGLPLYSYNFKNAEGKIDSALFAGGIVAISQLMKEATKSQAAITELKMEDETHLLIEVKPKILAILLTPKVTIFLRDTIKRFATRFSEKFESKLDDFEIVETSIFSPEGTKMLYESLGIPQP